MYVGVPWTPFGAHASLRRVIALGSCLICQHNKATLHLVAARSCPRPLLSLLKKMQSF